MRRTKAAALMMATVAASSVLSLASGATAQAAPGGSPTKVLDCRTSTDYKSGRAVCTNNTNRVVAFRVLVVCGLSVDRSGPWITLLRGQTGSSTATCGLTTSGVGGVDWEEGS